MQENSFVMIIHSVEYYFCKRFINMSNRQPDKFSMKYNLSLIPTMEPITKKLIKTLSWTQSPPLLHWKCNIAVNHKYVQFKLSYLICLDKSEASALHLVEVDLCEFLKVGNSNSQIFRLGLRSRSPWKFLSISKLLFEHTRRHNLGMASEAHF